MQHQGCGMKTTIMKKFFLLLLFSFFLGASGNAQKYSMKNLTGRWESEEGGGIEVIDSNKIFIVYGSEKKQIASYQADFSRSPAWFDFVIRDSGQSISFKNLLLFIY